MSATPTEWQLDPRLAADSFWVAERENCQIRLFNDGRYFWVVLVPMIERATEWHRLPAQMRATIDGLMAEIAEIILAYKGDDQVAPAIKINIGGLGNIVRQCHIHILGRHEKDPAWPGPVWGHSPALPLDDKSQAARIDALKAGFLS